MNAALLAAAGAILSFAPPAVASSPPAGPAPGERVMDLPLSDGRSQRVLYATPDRPRATLIMLPGGSGKVGMGGDGVLRHDRNFVVRTRAEWVARGYAVLIPDAAPGTSLRGARSAPACGRRVTELATFAEGQDHAPVFLIGTSQGTIAAVNGAAHARAGLIAGMILTEPVTLPGRLSSETVFDADPQDVRVPALVVANRDDACPVAPPAMAPRLAAAMVWSPSASVLTVNGGVQRSGSSCGSLSPHGYDGIEGAVIDAISQWLRAHGG